eukprot:gnl/Spiro4/15322_TR8233_c0_g1_i1.p1 gnl/Spiro4/15322_TR8233_c0_g1~~gnl/Spiro4/15322_TR8233_c0_g1_i1.p1  ORF type:complete len:528 (+),score=171.83 gnl/Spiro4/15322_TR8233_c0_g1_i1:46-1584(+)
MIDSWGFWVFFALLILGLFSFAYLVVRYYSNPHEQRGSVTLSVVLTLATSLLCVLVIPVDVGVLSATVDPATGKRVVDADVVAQRVTDVETLYTVLFMCLVFFAFIVLPFFFFYAEENDDDTTSKKVCGALKYTILFIVVLLVLFIVGVFATRQPGEEWTKVIFNTGVFASALIFVVSCLAGFGFLLWIFYTSHGMTSLPVEFIKPKRTFKTMTLDMSTQIAVVRERIRGIQSRYALTRIPWDPKDKDDLENYKRDERRLSAQITLSQDVDSNSFFNKCLWCFYPLRWALGLLFILLTLMLLFSNVVTSVDKGMHSNFNDGYVLVNGPQLKFNPLDRLLVASAAFFPLDLILLSGVVLFLFFCTLSGILRLGISLLFINLWKIRARGTSSHGIIMLAIYMTLVILALNASMLTFAPQYASFGSQTFLDTDGTVRPCVLDITAKPAANGVCTPSRLAIFFNQATIGHSFFAVILFYGNWLFVFFCLVWFLYSVLARESRYSSLHDEEEDVTAI